MRDQLDRLQSETGVRQTQLEKEKEALLEFVEESVKKQEEMEKEKAGLTEQVVQLRQRKGRGEQELTALRETVEETARERAVEARSMEIELEKIKKSLQINEEFMAK